MRQEYDRFALVLLSQLITNKYIIKALSEKKTGGGVILIEVGLLFAKNFGATIL